MTSNTKIPNWLIIVYTIISPWLILSTSIIICKVPIFGGHNSIYEHKVSETFGTGLFLLLVAGILFPVLSIINAKYSRFSITNIMVLLQLIILPLYCYIAFIETWQLFEFIGFVHRAYPNPSNYSLSFNPLLIIAFFIFFNYSLLVLHYSKYRFRADLRQIVYYLPMAFSLFVLIIAIFIPKPNTQIYLTG